MATTVMAPRPIAGSPTRVGVARIVRPAPPHSVTIAAPTANAPRVAQTVSANCGASDCSRPSIHEMPDTLVTIQATTAPPLTRAVAAATGAAATQQRDQPDEDLRSGDGDEQPRQRRILSVNPDGGGVDGPSPQRGDPLQRCDPTRVGGRCARRLIALLGRWSRRRTVVVWFAHTDDGKTGDEPVKSGKSPDRSLRP